MATNFAAHRPVKWITDQPLALGRLRWMLRKTYRYRGRGGRRRLRAVGAVWKASRTPVLNLTPTHPALWDTESP
jgi:hypothetical protein